VRRLERTDPTIESSGEAEVAPPAAGFSLVELLAVIAIMGLLASLALPPLQEAREQAKIVRTIGDIKAIQTDIEGLSTLPPDLAAIGRSGLLDPWGRPYVYYRFPPPPPPIPPPARRDRFLVPINSEYDLYSLGPDGASAPALQSAWGRDDIVRANDGGWVGVAWKY
jgi:general secretion pathway protein G